MPRQGSLLFEEYEKVADDLHAKGESPTVSRTREVLGRGSRDTHNKYQKIWRKNREKDRAALALPEDGLTVKVARIVQQLHEENETKIAEINLDATAAIEEAKAQQTAAENQLVESKRSLETTTQQLNDMTAAKALLQLDLNDHRQDIAIRIEREKALQEKVELLHGEAAAKVKILEVHQEKIVKQYEIFLEELKASHQVTFEQFIKQQEDIRHRHIAEIDALKTSLKAKERELDKYHNVELARQKVEADNTSLRIERDHLLQAYQALTAKDEDHTKQFAVLQNQLQKNNETIMLTSEGVNLTHEKLEVLAHSLNVHFTRQAKSVEDAKEKLRSIEHAD
jgi:hypothetical protein